MGAEFVTLDDASLNRWIMKFTDELNVSIETVCRYAMRLALRDIIRESPPHSLASGRASLIPDFRRASRPMTLSMFAWSKARTISRLAQVADFEDAMLPTVVKKEITTKRGTKKVSRTIMSRISVATQKSDVAAINAILSNMQGKLRAWRVVPFSDSLFRNVPRDGKGRAINQHKFVLDYQSWKRKLAQAQGNVGRCKAGWLPSYYGVGGKQAPDWVARHAVGARGNPIAIKREGGRFMIEAENHAYGIGRTAWFINHVFKLRAEAMRKDFHLYKDGTKDVSQIT